VGTHSEVWKSRIDKVQFSFRPRLLLKEKKKEKHYVRCERLEKGGKEKRIEG
jgi:hypothetical protein